MGFLDKIKSKISQDDDDPDELDTDSAPDEAGEDGEDGEDDSSGGGGRFGFAGGLLNKAKKLSSGGDGDEGGGIGGLFGKVKGLGGGKKNSADPDLDLDDLDLDDDDATAGLFDTPNAGKSDDSDEQPIRRSGIAAALDGKPDEDEASKEEGEAAPVVPVAIGSGPAVPTLDLDSLFEEEFVINPVMRDLAESLDDISAVDLAADLRTFMDELQ